jgi:hypothetical protein
VGYSHIIGFLGTVPIFVAGGHKNGTVPFARSPDWLLPPQAEQWKSLSSRDGAAAPPRRSDKNLTEKLLAGRLTQ